MKRWLAVFCLLGLLFSQIAGSLPASAAASSVLPGDPDGDGNVSMKDALLTRRYIAHQGELVSPTAADVNADDSIDMRDVLLIRKYIAHLIEAFPTSPDNPPLSDLSSRTAFFRYGYEQLSTLEKAAYTETVAAVEANLGDDTTARDGANGLTVVFRAPLPSESSAACVFRALYADHPEFFFLCRDFSYSHTPDGEVTALLLHYFMSADERAQAELLLTQTLNAWVTELPDGAADADKEIALHDRLCAACTYPSGDGPYPDASYSPYGALILGSAVCDGYARALQLLCLAAGLKATVVEGFDQNGAEHMWNVVYIDGEPYYVDPTWDDSQAVLSHAYCNITTADAAASHTMNFWFPTPPTCTATQYNYFRYTKRYVTAADGEDFARLVLAARQNGAEWVEVRCAPNVMSTDRQLTESGRLIDLINTIAPADTAPFGGYVYYFFDSVNVITLLI